MARRNKTLFAVCLTILLIVIDQAIKVWVKTHMCLGEQIEIAPWFKIDFIENRGMAWGMQLGSKLFLSIFRIVAVGFLIWYLRLQIKKNARWGYIAMLCLICAGAAGNIFDSIVYGQIFSESTPFTVSTFVPWGQGYETKLLCGSVVDMFYFPLFHGTFPTWFPIWGGHDFTFFNAIFNFADACITTGVLCLLIFYNKELSAAGRKSQKAAPTDDEGNVEGKQPDAEGKAQEQA